MSWSVGAFGKAEKVAAKLEADFKAITYLKEPEASIKDLAAGIVAKTLQDFTAPALAVKVDASGSMSTGTDGNSHSLTITVQPLYGLVE